MLIFTWGKIRTFVRMLNFRNRFYGNVYLFNIEGNIRSKAEVNLIGFIDMFSCN